MTSTLLLWQILPMNQGMTPLLDDGWMNPYAVINKTQGFNLAFLANIQPGLTPATGSGTSCFDQQLAVICHVGTPSPNCKNMNPGLSLLYTSLTASIT